MWCFNHNFPAVLQTSVMARAALAVFLSMAASWTTIAQTPSQASAAPEEHRIITASEDAGGKHLYNVIGLVADDNQHRLPKDQLDSAIAQRARDWITRLQITKVAGIQLDPMGELYVTAGRDALAKQQFAARLATPGLSLADKAYTLFLGIRLFGAKTSDTSRMQIALAYLAQLDALPRSVVRTQRAAHNWLGRAYYIAGDGDAVIAQLMHAFALLPKIPFMYRAEGRLGFEPFVQLADVLSGRPNGRARIDSLANWLISQFQAPADLVAKDSVNYWTGVALVNEFKQTLQMTDFLGRPAPVIAAHYWWNTETPKTLSPDDSSARIKPLDDGRIRLIEFGDVKCGACVHAVSIMDKMLKTLPSTVELLYATNGIGMWGAESVSASEEAAHLRNFYYVNRGFRVPIALWTGARFPDIDGGGTLVKAPPTWVALGSQIKPVFIVTDGRGVIRHAGGIVEDLLPERRAIQFLIAEAARQPSGATTSP